MSIEIPEIEISNGWVGQFVDGSLGWNMPGHLAPWSPNNPHKGFIRVATWRDKQRYFLCRITIDPILDSMGRPITRLGK